METGSGAFEPIQSIGVFHYDETLDLRAVSSQLATIGLPSSGPAKIPGESKPDTLYFNFTTPAAWMANKEYRTHGEFRIIYKIGENTKHCDFKFVDARFTSDANPTKDECAMATKDLVQAAINLADTANRLECKNNFETKVVTVNGVLQVIVVKKAGSNALILQSAPNHGTTGGVIQFVCN